MTDIKRFPNRVKGPSSEMSISSSFVGDVKDLRHIAQTLPEYHIPIEPTAFGVRGDGEAVAVDTVGKWLFGVPGYIPHVELVSDDGRVLLRFPQKSPGEVYLLIGVLVRKLGT